MKFAEAVDQDRRLMILQLLDQTDGYSLNANILRDALGHIGHRRSMDRVRNDVAWLKEQGLVETCDVGSILVIQATERGIDVARGLTQAHGVKRPDPE